MPEPGKPEINFYAVYAISSLFILRIEKNKNAAMSNTDMIIVGIIVLSKILSISAALKRR